MLEEIEELSYRIQDVITREKEIHQKLEDLKKTEKYQTIATHPNKNFRGQKIMLGSILSVHVIDARDIKAANGKSNANSQLKLSIEN